jgi:hypothetical protein
MTMTRPAFRQARIRAVIICACLLASSVTWAADTRRFPIGDQALALEGGYIVPQEKSIGTVIGARENRIYFGPGEVLYVRFARNLEVHPGDWLTVYRVTNPVFHPLTTAYMGRIVQVLGLLEIMSEPKNRVAEVRVVKPFDSMANGDPVMLYTLPAEIPDQAKSNEPVTGMIVEFKVPRTVTAQGEIVYIDLGTEDGIELGDRLKVMRSGARESLKTYLPDFPVAELKVITVQQRTATSKVVRSLTGVRRGDFVTRLNSPAAGPVDHDSNGQAPNP